MTLFLLCSSIIIIPLHPPRREAEPRPGLGPDQAGGEKTLQNQSARTWECTQVIFVWEDQKALTFRCFPDMNIQHPYWNLIWVSLSQGSFHQCLLPEATADWQPNFSKEHAGKKGRSGGVGDVRGAKPGRAGADEWRGTDSWIRGRRGRVI